LQHLKLPATNEGAVSINDEPIECVYDDIQPALALPTHEKFNMKDAPAPAENEAFNVSDLEEITRAISPELKATEIQVPMLEGMMNTKEFDVAIERGRPDPEMINQLKWEEDGEDDYGDDDDYDDYDDDDDDEVYAGGTSGGGGGTTSSDDVLLEEEVKRKPEKSKEKNAMLVVSLKRDPSDVNPLQKDVDLEKGPETFREKLEDRFWDFGDWLSFYCELIGGKIGGWMGRDEWDEDFRRYVGLGVVMAIFFVLLMAVLIPLALK